MGKPADKLLIEMWITLYQKLSLLSPQVKLSFINKKQTEYPQFNPQFIDTAQCFALMILYVL